MVGFVLNMIDGLRLSELNRYNIVTERRETAEE
jgi:hypothetical protein